MSVVAWDGKILAADRQSNYGDTIRTTRKLWKLDSGEVIAIIGNIANGLLVKEWYENGAKQEAWPECQKTDEWAQFITASKDGCFYYNSQPVRMKVLDPFCAWGVGRAAALGAMEMGADAIKAVEIASKYVSGCGRGCDYGSVKSHNPNPIMIKDFSKRSELKGIRY
jgi:hypothetical protein